MFGRKKFPLTTFTIKVDTSSPFWQASARKVLDKARGVRSFMLDDYGVEVFGNVDPQRILEKLAKAGVHGVICLGTPNPNGDHLYHEHGGGFCDPCGTAGGYVCNLHGCDYGDHDRCCGNGGDFPPGPFAKLARELFHNRRRRPPPPLTTRQSFQYVNRSIGCFNLM